MGIIVDFECMIGISLGGGILINGILMIGCGILSKGIENGGCLMVLWMWCLCGLSNGGSICLFCDVV